MLIDVHAHLTDKKYQGAGDELARKTFTDEPRVIVDTGTNPADCAEAFRHAQAFERVYCAVGVHPEFADLYDEKTEKMLEEWAKSEKTVAIGEIGLDYFHTDIPAKDVQKSAFRRQIDLADKLGLPVVIHVRDAHGDAAELLLSCREKLTHGVLLHCYSGSKELLKTYDKIDAYYSFGGVLTFKNAKEKPEIVRAIRRERLLLETDCPCLTPEPFRGSVNYPSYIRYSAAKMAEILGLTPEETADLTTENARRLFRSIKI